MPRQHHANRARFRERALVCNLTGHLRHRYFCDKANMDAEPKAQAQRCKAGYYCPLRSTTNEGVPTWDRNSADKYESYTYTSNPHATSALPVKQECGTKGFNPSASDLNGWNKDKECLCEPGYYCPEGSSTHEGRPVEDEVPHAVLACQSADRCMNFGGSVRCTCDPGHYCPLGSATGHGCPVQKESESP